MSNGLLQAVEDPQALALFSERLGEQYQQPFIYDLERTIESTERDDPNYYSRIPRSLVTASDIGTFVTGTGSSIYDEVSAFMRETEHELILVTCFWASSVSRDYINTTLRSLSDKAVRRGTDKIRVRLCFS